MSKVRMVTESAGPAGNRHAGHVYAVPPAEGWELVRGGYAVWVDAPRAVIETAAMPEPENAARRVRAPRKPRAT
jgi:hypothetical protein